MSKVKIEKKIVGYSVKQADDKNAEKQRPEFRREMTEGGAEVIRMHERLERPEMLIGRDEIIRQRIFCRVLTVAGHRHRIGINQFTICQQFE